MNILKFNDGEQQASELAKALAEKITQVLSSKPQVCLALSGGKSPIKLFQKLNSYPLAWEKVTITLVDERFLAADHPDSNENLVKTHLLIKEAEKAFFIGLAGDATNILSAVNNANLHVREIDIAVLGMGEDGHTASLFPCCAELKTALDPRLTPEKYIITQPKSANYQRIGLSLAGIISIPHLFISLNGQNKLTVLAKAAATKSFDYPISQVLAARKDVQIFWHA